MKQTRVARLFRDGACQALRLPAEFGFEGGEVYATRDDDTGDVVLSSRLGADAWNEFFASLHCFSGPAGCGAATQADAPVPASAAGS